MTKLKSLRVLSFGLGLAVLLGTPAAQLVAQEAQEPAPAPNPAQERTGIEEIVVTSTYRESALMDTPMAIDAFSAGQLQDIGATDLQSLIGALPSVSMSTGGASNNRYSIRGVTSPAGTLSYEQNFGTTAVYLDETPVSSAQGPARQIGGSMFDLDRVEILKGPQGTLWGEGSMAGTIRYLSRQPSTEGFELKLNTRLSTWHGESDENSYRGDVMVNIPLGETLAARAVFYNGSTGGFIDRAGPMRSDLATEPGELSIKSNANDTTEQGGRLSLLWNATDLLTLRGTFSLARTEVDDDSIGCSFYSNCVIHNPDNPPSSRDEVKTYSFVAEYESRWGEFTSATSYMHRDGQVRSNTYQETTNGFSDFVTNLINFPEVVAGRPRLVPGGGATGADLFFGLCTFVAIPGVIEACNSNNLSSFGRNSKIESKRWIQELRFVSEDFLDDRLRFTGGLYFKSTRDLINSSQPFGMQNAPVTGVDVLFFGPLEDRQQFAPPFVEFFTEEGNNHHDQLREHSVYGEASYDLLETLELTLGARLSRMFLNWEYPNITNREKFLAPKVSLSWRPRDGWLLYGTVSTGFRPGNVNAGQQFNVDQLEKAGLQDEADAIKEQLITYDGDDVVNHEIGAKLSFLDNRVQVTGSGYWMKWNDTIVRLTTTLNQVAGVLLINSFYSANAGDATVLGVEGQVTALLTDSLTVNVGGNLNNSKIEEDSPGVEKGNRLAYAPRYKVNVGLSYRFPLLDWDAEVRVDNYRVAQSYAGVGNNATDRIPGYDLTNARLTVRDADRWRVALYGHNLFGEEYVYFRGDGGLCGNMCPLISYGRPRELGVEVSYDFY